MYYLQFHNLNYRIVENIVTIMQGKKASITCKTICLNQTGVDLSMEVYDEELEAYKGVRGMPWHQKETKDVLSCEKLWGAAREL